MKTLNQMAKEAILVQDACNLSGIAISFGQVMQDLRKHLPDIGTTELNHHPIAVMYSSKIASLTNSESGLEFSKAYGWCQDKENEQ